MADRFYRINARAYTDALRQVAGKPLTHISKELGYADTYLGNTITYGKIRACAAHQIEQMYKFPVSPYIIPEKKEEPKKLNTESCEFRALMDQIEELIAAYLLGQGVMKA